MKGLKVFLLSFILLFILGTAVFAQERTAVEEAVNLDENIQPADLGISEPSLLPDNPFYFLKSWVRGIRSFFTFNPVRKAELRMRFANEKLMEVKKLVELKKDPEIIKRATENYQKEVEKIKGQVEKIKEKAKENPQVESFLEKFIDQQTLHQKLLDRLENQVPPEVFEKIKEARERHLERFKDVMLKLEDRKEKISEKLEKILEKQKGSDFKEFKNLEVLKELEEKMPENVKVEIEKAQEKMNERLQEKVEKMPAEEKERLKGYVEKISGDKLKHLEILSNLEAEEIPEKLREEIEKAKEKGIEIIEKEKISVKEAKRAIEMAENEILKAEEKIKEISEEKYGGRAAKRLLELAREHLDKAKMAFDEKKYGKAFGLANSAYHEAVNCQRIVEEIGEIKKSPQKMKEKMEKLYPGIELPKEVTKCEIPLMKKCEKGQVMRIEKDENGCPVFKCEEIEIPKVP